MPCKRCLAKLEKKSKIKMKNACRHGSSTNEAGTSTFTLSTLSLLLLISIFILYDVVLSNVHNTDFEALKTDLHDNVHNQSEALSVIYDNLNNVQKSENVTIVSFVGTTGVGKTFIANIIKKYFHTYFYECWNTLKLVRQEQILNNIKSSSTTSLVVLDDLTVGDLDNVLDFIKKIPKDVATFVICIFNIQETDAVLNHRINYDNVDKIVEKFEMAEIIQGLARFHEFSKEEAGNWIIKELLKKKVDTETRLKIVKTLLENHDVKYSGLKGLGSKMYLEL